MGMPSRPPDGLGASFSGLLACTEPGRFSEQCLVRHYPKLQSRRIVQHTAQGQAAEGTGCTWLLVVERAWPSDASCASSEPTSERPACTKA